MQQGELGAARWSAARLGRRRALGLAGGAGTAAFLAACGGGKTETGDATAEATRGAGIIAGSQSGEETPKPGGSLTYHWPLTPPLDPTVNTTYTVQRLAGFVYPRLLKFKTDRNPATAQNYETMPDLAIAQPEVTDGGLTYIFKLRTDAKSHTKPPLNGRPYTADDVKASYDRFINEPKNQNRGVFTQAGVLGIETPDAGTVIFKLSKPYAPFLSMIANPQYLWIMPREVGSTLDPERDMVGAGPFTLESNQPDVAIRLRKHPDYFLKGQPYVDSVTLAIVQEAANQLAQFQAAKLDMATLTHEQIAEARRAAPQATVIKFPSGTMPFLFTQLRGNGPFKDERLRQALSLAIDRDALLKLTWDGEGWWQNMVPVHLGKWWTDPKDPANRPSTRFFGSGDRKKDLAEAAALLKAAGYDEQKKLPVKFYYTPNGYTDRYNQWAEATAGFLKETNIFAPTTVTADYRGEWIVSGGVLFGRIPDDGVAFALQSGFPDAHDYLFNPLHSKSTRNHAGVNDPEIDAMFDREVVTLDEAERVKAIRAITARLNEKAYYAPTMIGPDYWVLQPWVKNFTLGLSYGWGTEIFANTFVSK
jgi:peptide/nickel transport system substrate-binding protein